MLPVIAMNKQRIYRYELAKHIKRNVGCPSPGCEKDKGTKGGYTLYIDNKTNELLPHDFGKCFKCGYHKYPTKDNYIKATKDRANYTIRKNMRTANAQQVAKQKRYISYLYYKRLLITDDKELPAFFQTILHQNPNLKESTIRTIIKMYLIGSLDFETIVFPYIDINGKIHAAQVKKFDQSNKTTENSWLHVPPYSLKWLGLDDSLHLEWFQEYKKSPSKVGCFMGEHLLSNKKLLAVTNGVRLHESMKNAIYLSLFNGLPSKSNELHIAAGSLSYFKKEKLNILRQIYDKKRYFSVWPDPEDKAYAAWNSEIISAPAPPQWTLHCFNWRHHGMKNGVDVADEVIKEWAKEQIEDVDWYAYEIKKLNEIMEYLMVTDRLNLTDEQKAEIELQKKLEKEKQCPRYKAWLKYQESIQLKNCWGYGKPVYIYPENIWPDKEKKKENPNRLGTFSIELFKKL